MYLKAGDVLSRVKYLIGKEEGEYTYENVKKNLKSKCKIIGMNDSYYFDAEEIWINYFMCDERLKRILNNKRISHIYELLQHKFEDLLFLRDLRERNLKEMELNEEDLIEYE